MAEYFARLGFDVVSLIVLVSKTIGEMARIAPDSLVERAPRRPFARGRSALHILHGAALGWRSLGEIETVIGRPVVTSNQASVWRAACAIAATMMRIRRYGRLIALAAPEGHPA